MPTLLFLRGCVTLTHRFFVPLSSSRIRTHTHPPTHGLCSTQLFSDSLQLPLFIGATRSTTLSKRELSQLASLVHSRFRLLELDMSPWLDVLPDGWGSKLVQLRQAVKQELLQVRLFRWRYCSR